MYIYQVSCDTSSYITTSIDEKIWSSPATYTLTKPENYTFYFMKRALEPKWSLGRNDVLATIVSEFHAPQHHSQDEFKTPDIIWLHVHRMEKAAP